ncbi:MAG: hypothetical protein H6907_08935 [Hyphomicrobiales bacterium]|nr:hypothetical protein [Hyphomicrobiales bacterium]MCP5371842.1 hypothetical protein [Hyphomicrobiales bacterium]
MSDINPAALGTDIAAATGARPRAYQAAREVERRAAVTQGDDNPRNRAALQRLGQLLASGRPLDDNVPRGYYLNIQV